MNDHRSDEPDSPTATPDSGGRRAAWSRRIAIGVLVAFALFVLWNVVTVLLLAWRSVMDGQGGPLS